MAVRDAATLRAHADPLVSPRLLQRPLQQQTLGVELAFLDDPAQRPIGMTRIEPVDERCGQAPDHRPPEVWLGGGQHRMPVDQARAQLLMVWLVSRSPVCLFSLDAAGGASTGSRVRDVSGALTCPRDRLGLRVVLRLVLL